MKKFLTTIITLVLVFVQVQASQVFPVTKDCLFLKVSDSFDVADYGNRFTCWDETERINMNPNYIVRVRNVSQSGANHQRFLTNNMPEFGAPILGAVHGTNDINLQLYTSGNLGGSSESESNYVYTNMVVEFKFPTEMVNKVGILTNDYPWSTNGIRKCAYGDSAYCQPVGSDQAELYSRGSSNAAVEAGWPFINSWSHTAYMETNTYDGGCALYFPLGHPANELQGARVILDLLEEQESTNVWTCVLNWNTGNPSTNSCAMVSISRSSTNITGTIKLDRNGMTTEIPDSQHTNDIRQTFILDTRTTNIFHEDLRLTGCPDGRYVTQIDGENLATNDTIAGAFTVNFFHIYAGPWHRQQMLVLDGCRLMRDVSTTNASVDTPFNSFLTAFGSQATVYWPTNSGNSDYTALLQSKAFDMELLDKTNHINAQQSTHTLNVFLQTTLPSGIIQKANIGSHKRF